MPIILNKGLKNVPLGQQLCQELRRLILGGEYEPGKRLPSTREMADLVAVSRPIVNAAYEQLVSEGYLESFAGSGTFVTRQLRQDALTVWRQQVPAQAKAMHISQAAQHIGQLPFQILPQSPIDFRDRKVTVDVEFRRKFEKAMRNHIDTASSSALGYSSDPRGDLRFRTVLADYLRRSRHTNCQPEQIIAVSGTLQALNMICRVHCDPGDSIGMENPGFQMARQLFESRALKVAAFPVDTEGMQVDAVADSQNLRFVYATASHQMPMGSVLSLSRRLELLRLAYEKGFLIVEDDFNGEYRYAKKMVPALQGIDSHGVVLYLGSFSKSLFPALRLGYMVVPEALVSLYIRAKRLADNHSPLLEQYALADLIENGAFERHIHRMKDIYDGRRQLLIAELQKHFGERVTVLGESAGLHVIARIRLNHSDAEVVQEAMQAGVAIETTARHYESNHVPGEFVFSYSDIEEEDIRNGVAKLSAIVGSRTK